MDGPFSRRSLFWIAGITAASLIGALFAAALDEGTVVEVGPSTYSDSALGHSILLEALRRESVPVLVSRSDSAQKAGRRGVLVVAEPRLETAGSTDRLRELARHANVALFVLPKRAGAPDPTEPRFVGSVETLRESDVYDVLRELDVEATVERPESVSDWQSDVFDTRPDLEEPQLVTGRLIEPWIACDEGILLGRILGDDEWPNRHGELQLLLSDPDLLANHGIVRGDNASLVFEILGSLRNNTEDGSIVIDEAMHGHLGQDSFLAELARFPLVLLTCQAIASALFYLWAGVKRFGAPLPARSGLGDDKEALLDNSARLVLSTGRSTAMLKHYLEDSLRQAERRLSRGREVKDRDALIAQLDAIGRRRGVSVDLRALAGEALSLSEVKEAVAQDVTRVAQEIHAWRVEILRER
ncbi:MAG: hypothetical protein RL885_25320 [Planctomycetota bacterium]